MVMAKLCGYRQGSNTRLNLRYMHQITFVALKISITVGHELLTQTNINQ